MHAVWWIKDDQVPLGWGMDREKAGNTENVHNKGPSTLISENKHAITLCSQKAYLWE